MSKVGFFFYTGDWIKDTKVLSLAARGAWIDLLCVLHEHGGEITWRLDDLAQFWNITRCEGDTIVRDLSRLKVADVRNCPVDVPDLSHALSGQKDACVTEQSQDVVTITCRKMKRACLDRENTRLRKQNERERKSKYRNCHEPVTSKSSASSYSSSSSLNLNLKNHKNDSRQLHVDDPESLSVQDLVDSWNDSFKDQLAQVEWPLSTTRHKKARQRLREHAAMDFWQTVFNHIASSQFLLGKSNGTWRCSFDFIIANDTNCMKIYEGVYNGEKNQTR